MVQRVGQGCQERSGIQTSSAHTNSTAQRAGQGAERKTYKPHDIEDELRGLREGHTSLCNTEGRVREPRKDQHKPLLSKLQPALQGSTGGNRSTRKDFRDKSRAGCSEDMLRGPL